MLQNPQSCLAGMAALAPPTVAAEIHTIARAHRGGAESLLHDAQYSGYLVKEQSALRQLADLDSRLIPADLDYSIVSHLRHEAKEKLSHIRPRSLGQAMRVSGITPADITVLSIHLAARGGRQ